MVAAPIALIAPSEIALRRSDRTNLHKEEGCAAEGEREKGQKRGIERNEVNIELGGPTEKNSTWQAGWGQNRGRAIGLQRTAHGRTGKAHGRWECG